MTNSFFQGEDGKIFYHFREGEPMILYLHGFMGNNSIFKKQRKYLSKFGFGEIAPDLRGSGKSFKPKNKKDYRIGNFVSDLEDLLSKLEIGEFSIISHSMGTLISQAFASRNPENVESLVLISSLYSIRESLGWRYELFSSLKPLLDNLGSIFNSFSKINEKEKYQPEMGEERDYFEEIRQNFLQFWYFGKSPLLLAEALSEWDTEKEARRIEVPTLLIHGDNDFVIPKKSAYRLHELINDSEIVFLEGNHELLVENSEKVNLEIKDFLEKQT